jgi:hypothetical protein
MRPNEQGISDFFLDANGNLAVAKGPEAVAHHVRWRLMTFTGEWFLDVEAGMDWLENIMGKRYNPTLAEAMIKNETLTTPSVTGINSLSIGYDRNRRDLMVRGMDVSTEYDDQSIWISNVGIAT